MKKEPLKFVERNKIKVERDDQKDIFLSANVNTYSNVKNDSNQDELSGKD